LPPRPVNALSSETRGTSAGTGLYLINVTDTRERHGEGEGGRPLGGIGFSRSYSAVCAISDGERAAPLARYFKRHPTSVGRRKKERERENSIRTWPRDAGVRVFLALRRLNLRVRCNLRWGGEGL